MKVYVFYLLPPHLLLKGHIFQTYDSRIKFPLPYINCIKIFNRHVKPASEILCTLTTCPSYCDHKIMNISERGVRFSSNCMSIGSVVSIIVVFTTGVKLSMVVCEVILSQIKSFFFSFHQCLYP